MIPWHTDRYGHRFRNRPDGTVVMTFRGIDGALTVVHMDLRGGEYRRTFPPPVLLPHETAVRGGDEFDGNDDEIGYLRDLVAGALHPRDMASVEELALGQIRTVLGSWRKPVYLVPDDETPREYEAREDAMLDDGEDAVDRLAQIQEILSPAEMGPDYVGTCPSCGALHSQAHAVACPQGGINKIRVLLDRVTNPDAVGYQAFEEALTEIGRIVDEVNG